jgi:hypothetical protein
MRNLLSIVAAVAAILTLFALPMRAVAEESIWVSEPLDMYGRHYCGDQYTLVDSMPPNLSCETMVPDENGVDQKTVIAKTDKYGYTQVNASAMNRLWTADRLPDVSVDVLRQQPDIDAFLLFRSTLTVLGDERKWSIEATQIMVADFCATYAGKFIGDGFFSVMLINAYNNASNTVETFYGPVCVVYAKQTDYMRDQAKKLGFPAIPDNQVASAILAGMDKDGRWFIDTTVLDALGMSRELQLSKLACKDNDPRRLCNSTPYTAERADLPYYVHSAY